MEQRTRILVSACLLGEPCRYDGTAQPCQAVISLGATHDLVPVCPEQLGGLPTPRLPSEIQPDGRVVDCEGNDRTDAFRAGAQATVAYAREQHCTHAILKSRSPSCGVSEIYDGTFTGALIPGQGLAAQALSAAGLVIKDENRRFSQ